MFLPSILLVPLIFLAYILLRKPYNFWINRNVSQLNPIVFFGDSWRTLLRFQSLPEMIKSIYQKFPEKRYFGFYQFGTPVLVLKDVELIKQITIKDFDHFVDHRPFLPDDMDPLWTRNLFSLTGKKWRDMRITLSPSFTSSKMKFMFNLIESASRNFVKHFSNEEDQTDQDLQEQENRIREDRNLVKNQNPNQNSNEARNRENEVLEVELKDIFTRFTNDAIASTAFGIQIDSLKSNNDFYNLAKKATTFTGFFKSIKFFCFLFFPSIFKVFKVKFFDEDVRSFFTNVILENIRSREANKIIRPDMIHLLMETRKGNSKVFEKNPEILDTGFATAQEFKMDEDGVQSELTDIDIVAQAMIFIFGGFDTVSTLMCFMGYELAVNPDVQNRLRLEIREVLKENNGQVTYNALLSMKYLDMVVSETMRKWPIAILLDRLCTKPYTIKSSNPDEKDVHLPINTLVWIPVWGIHHDPKYFPNPDKFDPERFNDSNKSKIHPYAYLPFGTGPRNCIGSRFALLETKLIMFHLLNRFEIVPTAKSVIPLKISRKQIPLAAEDDFWFGLKEIREDCP